MTGDEIARLIYLLLLAAAIGGWLVMENRGSLGKMARQAAAWTLIFLGAIAAVGLWSDIRDTVAPRQALVASGTIEVPRGPDGHYRLVLEMNGKPVEFIVDTGASDVVLTLRDARRIGIDTEALVFSGTAYTANGVVRTARARVAEVRLGDIVDRDLAVSVTAGETDLSLLGMTYLQKFSRIEIADGRMRLVR